MYIIYISTYLYISPSHSISWKSEEEMPTLPEGSNCGRTSSMTWQRPSAAWDPLGICARWAPGQNQDDHTTSCHVLRKTESFQHIETDWSPFVCLLKGSLMVRCSMEVPIGSYCCALHSLHCVWTTRLYNTLWLGSFPRPWGGLNYAHIWFCPSQGVAVDLVGVFKHVLHNVAQSCT